MRAHPAAGQRGGQGWLPSFAFVRIAVVHNQVYGTSLATNLIFEIAIPFGKQRGYDAPGCELVSQGLVADPLSDFELVRSHPAQWHICRPNAKPADEGGLIACPPRRRPLAACGPAGGHQPGRPDSDELGVHHASGAR
jgi:hypothetical protein